MNYHIRLGEFNVNFSIIYNYHIIYIIFTKFRMRTKYRKWAAKRTINLYWDQKPQSCPSVCNAAKGRKVDHHFVERPISGI